MSGSSSGHVGDRPPSSVPVALGLRVVVTALATGTVAGMATFVYLQDALVPPWFTHWWALGLVTAAGGFVHVLSRSLEESVAAALLGLAVGGAVHVGVYVSPLFVLPDPPTGAEFLWYDPRVQDMLLATLVGRAVTAAVFAYLLAFFCGWLAVVSVYGLVVE